MEEKKTFWIKTNIINLKFNFCFLILTVFLFSCVTRKQLILPVNKNKWKLISIKIDDKSIYITENDSSYIFNFIPHKLVKKYNAVRGYISIRTNITNKESNYFIQSNFIHYTFYRDKSGVYKVGWNTGVGDTYKILNVNNFGRELGNALEIGKV